MKYNVNFTFGGCVEVEADSEEMAESVVAEMDDCNLWEICEDGFEIQSVEELPDSDCESY